MVKLINNTKVIKYLTVFTGLSYIMYYMWFRFIRLRLPKDIPFDLTILGFIILFTVCCIYIYILYRYLKPKAPHPKILKIISYISLIFYPLYVLDDLLQHNRYYKVIYYKFLRTIVKKTNALCESHTFRNKYSTNEYDEYINDLNDLMFYFKFRLFPKMFVLVIFAIDIFYFHKLDYFYFCLIIGTYYLLWQYLIFSARNILEDIIRFLEQHYVVYVISDDIEENYFIDPHKMKPINRYLDEDGNEDPDPIIFDDPNGVFYDNYYTQDININDLPDYTTNVRNFVDLQACSIDFEYTPYHYACIERPIARKKYCAIHNMKLQYTHVSEPEYDEISKELAKYFHKLMSFAIDLKLFLHHDLRIDERIIKLNMLIILGYLICWSYILIVSLPTLNILDIINLLENTYKRIDDPF